MNQLLLNVFAQRKSPVCLLAILTCENFVLEAYPRVDVSIVQALFGQLALLELLKANFA